MARMLLHSDYTVGWICALPLEMASAKAMLDKIHSPISQPASDHNAYALGNISGHNVAIACLPSGVYGTTAAATVVANMLPTFPSLQFGLMVGIGGGVPSKDADIRLGDVVVSIPTGTASGVIQYDFGKTLLDGEFQRTGSLNKPPPALLSAVSQVRSDFMIGKTFIQHLRNALQRHDKMREQFSRPTDDCLFKSTYNHQGTGSDCSECDQTQLVPRGPRATHEPCIHYGLIASGNQVMKDAETRDSIATKIGGVLCFEMEAAGVMDQLPCLVIRGICDYCDSHKHNAWQGYASITAAAYTKELLQAVPIVSGPSHSEGQQAPKAEEYREKLINSLEFEYIEERYNSIKLARPGTCNWLLTHKSYQYWLDKSQIAHHHGLLWLKGKPGAGKSTMVKFALCETKRLIREGIEREPGARKLVMVNTAFSETKRLRWEDIDRKPGAGKSTMMNFALRETKRLIQEGISRKPGAGKSTVVNAPCETRPLRRKDVERKPDAGKSTMVNNAPFLGIRCPGTKDIFISFFFNARGSSLQKTPLGMYRSLLFQFFAGFPQARDVFDNFDILQLPRGPSYSWTIPQLQDVLNHAIQRLRGRWLWIFVDALDECHEDQIRDVVIFFNLLTSHAMESGIDIRVLFASRHYPRITTPKKVELILEDETEHARDIRHYIHSELRASNEGHSRRVDKIREELFVRASGVFIWVVLVVQILNKAYDHGQIIGLEKKFQELPDDLDELFKGILTRDSQNIEGMRLCIQWILFAQRPLYREELYVAILSGTHPENIGSFDPKEVAPEDMDASILSCSKGLAELAPSSWGRSPTVHFIHETVRDFLLKENGMQYIQGTSNHNLLGYGHDALRQCCFNCLLSTQEALLATPVPVDSQHSDALERIHRSPRNLDYAEVLRRRKRLSLILPFMGYAVQNILYHANSAEANGVSQEYFLREFPVRTWVHLAKVIRTTGDWVDPFYVSESFSPDSGLLYILSKGNFAPLIEVMVRVNPQIDIHGGQHGSPLRVAIKRRHHDALIALLTPGPHSLLRPPSRSEIETLIYDYEWADRVQPESLLRFHFQRSTESSIMTILRSGRFDMRPEVLAKSHWAIAVDRGHEEVVEFILGSQDMDPDVPDSQGLTPLCRATKFGRPNIALLLLQGTKKANVNSQSFDGRSPLSYAAENGLENLVKLLLRHPDVEINSRCIEGKSPLSYAAENGHENVFKLLLSHPELEINSRDNKGRTPFFHAARRGRENIVKLLINTQRADVISRDNISHTALSYAVLFGHEPVVRQILNTGEANVNSYDEIHGRTPLSFAVGHGYLSIAKLLLQIPDIDITIPDIRDRTVFHYARRPGREAMASLLASIHQ